MNINIRQEYNRAYKQYPKRIRRRIVDYAREHPEEHLTVNLKGLVDLNTEFLISMFLNINELVPNPNRLEVLVDFTNMEIQIEAYRGVPRRNMETDYKKYGAELEEMLENCPEHYVLESEMEEEEWKKESPSVKEMHTLLSETMADRVYLYLRRNEIYQKDIAEKTGIDEARLRRILQVNSVNTELMTMEEFLLLCSAMEKVPHIEMWDNHYHEHIGGQEEC